MLGLKVLGIQSVSAVIIGDRSFYGWNPRELAISVPSKGFPFLPGYIKKNGRDDVTDWIWQVPGFRSGRWWKGAFAVPGYAVIFLLMAGGLFGGGLHVLATNVVGMPGLIFYLKLGPWVNAFGPPYVATDAFLALVYILNARASTFLLGAESLAIILLAANAWGIRASIPLFNSRSKGPRIAGWVLLLFLCIIALAVTLERRPWGFLRA